MNLFLQMGLNEKEKPLPKHSVDKHGWGGGGRGSRNPYMKKLGAPRQPRKHGVGRGERKNKQQQHQASYSMSPKKYFQYTVYPFNPNLKHKARILGTLPIPPNPSDPPEPTYILSKLSFEKTVDPVDQCTILDHAYHKGAFDPPPPTPLASVYSAAAAISSLNGLGNKLQHNSSKSSSSSSHHSSFNNNSLSPILNQITNNKAVFGIARTGNSSGPNTLSPSTPPPKVSHSTSYLVPQHPGLIPPPLVLPLQMTTPRQLPPPPTSSKKDTSNNSSSTFQSSHHQRRHSESSEDDLGDPDPQGEETETAPENEEEDDVSPAKDKEKEKQQQQQSQEAVEDSVTRCVCGFLHDDGYMICCDKCSVWQHVDCVDIDRNNIPEEYLCEDCHPRPIDKLKAVAIQIQKIKKLNKQQPIDSDANSDSSHSSTERIKRKRKTTTVKQKRAKKTTTPNTTVKRRRKSSSNVTGGTPNSTGPLNNSTNSNLSKGGNSPSPLSTPAATPGPKRKLNTSNLNNIVHSNNKRKMITVSEKKQTPGEKKNSKILSPLNKLTTTPNNAVDGGKGEKKNHVQKRTPKKQQTDKKLLNNNTLKRKSSSLLLCSENKLLNDLTSSKKEKEAAAAAASTDPDSMSDGESSTPMTRWVDNYEEATLNYYAPDLRTKIENLKLNGSHTDVKLPPLLISTAVQKCRASLLGNGTKILATSCQMNANQPLIEMRGRYLLTGTDKKNLPTPGQHVFFYAMQSEGINIIIDCRSYGNDARFVRRSCKPNAVMKHCIDKGSIHIYLTAITMISKNSEITISFSSGGNTELCTCGNKDTCTAVTQKDKMLTERRCFEQSQQTTTSKLEVKTEIKSSPISSPLPSPVPSTESTKQEPLPFEESPPPKSETESLSTPPDSQIQSEIKTKDEKKVETCVNNRTSNTSSTPVPSTPLTTSTKKKEEPKESTPNSSSDEQQSETKTKSKTTSTPGDRSKTTKKSVSLCEEKRPKKIQLRKKSETTRRKRSETSQSQEDTAEDNSEDELSDKPLAPARRSSTSAAKSTPVKSDTAESKSPNNTPTKLSREQRKFEAILKAFEKMEKQSQHHRQKEPRVRKDSTAVDKNDDTSAQSRAKSTKKIVRKRKGRSKSFSTTSATARTRRASQRNRQSSSKEENSSEDDETEEDEEGNDSSDPAVPPVNNTTPTPGTPSFKLPLTRQSSTIEPGSPEKSTENSVKKRWLKQVISESPRIESPSPVGEQMGPFKKRRLARASLSSEDKSSPTTPTLPEDDTSGGGGGSVTSEPTITPKSAYACLDKESSNSPKPLEQSISSQPKNPEEPAGTKNSSTLNTVAKDDALVVPTGTSVLPPSTSSFPTSSIPYPAQQSSANSLTTTSCSIASSSYVPVPTFGSPSPSLHNTHSFSTPTNILKNDQQLPLQTPPSSSFTSNSSFSSFNLDPAWIPSYSLDTPTRTSSPGVCGPVSTPVTPMEPPPLPPVVQKEKPLFKRKLSLSEYRQRRGSTFNSTPSTTTTSSSSTSLTSSFDLPPSSVDTSSTTESRRPVSPPSGNHSDTSDDESQDICRNDITQNASQVIEKSVMVDNMLSKLSKAADLLEENNAFRDKLLRFPKSSSVNNNSVQPPLPPPPPPPHHQKPKPILEEPYDTFLNGPKESLTERLNRQFNLKISDDPPLLPPIPLPPIDPPLPPLPEFNRRPNMAPVTINTPYGTISSEIYVPKLGGYSKRSLPNRINK